MNQHTSWHTLSIKETIEELTTSSEGLSEKEARIRLKKYGLNGIVIQKKVPLLKIFSRQFLSPFVYLLVFAAIVSIILGHASDSIIIFVAVFITVGFGFFQEAKAEKTMEALADLVVPKTTVKRDGVLYEIDSEKLVPGDIFAIGEGDKIAADARLIEVRNLNIEEGLLTGEAVAVSKQINPIEKGKSLPERINMVYRGTVAARGRGLAVVVHTGENTELGKIATTVHNIGEAQTPLQEKIARIALVITWLVLIVLVLLVAVGLLRSIPIVELLTTSIAVAVAAIPESLVAVTTIILAVGMTRLLRSKALVRRLVSAESLGSTTVVCVDKTGTLTEGKMEVADVYGVEESMSITLKKFILTIAMVTNEAYFEGKKGQSIENANIHGDPTERALLEAGRSAGLSKEYSKREEHLIDELPFESENQFMATLVDEENGIERLYIKGSPEKIISSAHYVFDSKENKRVLLDKEKRHILETKSNELSKAGFRVLAVGYKDIQKKRIEKDLDAPLAHISQLGENPILDSVVVGLIALSDPVRTTVASAVTEAQSAGVRVIMITGDHKLTAQTIASEIGLPSFDHAVLLGDELANMSDEDLEKVVSSISVYARILPHDKLRIVSALQRCGETVAMTGDGLNDAPALKQAGIGIAMGAGTDVAKEASDLIILDNNFSTIISAIKEGRVIIDNIRKVTLYLLKDSFSEVILLGASILAGLPLPILAGQVLWINIVEDGLPAFSFAYEPADPDIMKRTPEGRNKPLLTSEMKAITAVISITAAGLLLGVFLILDLILKYEPTHIQSIMFVSLALNSLVLIFSMKMLDRPLWNIPIFNNLYLVGSVIFGLCMLVGAVYIPLLQNLLHLIPLHFFDWSIAIGISLIQLVLLEGVKYLFYRKKNNS